MAWSPADTALGIHDVATGIGVICCWLAMLLDAIQFCILWKGRGGVSVVNGVSWTLLGMTVYSIALSAANLCTIIGYAVIVAQWHMHRGNCGGWRQCGETMPESSTLWEWWSMILLMMQFMMQCVHGLWFAFHPHPADTGYTKLTSDEGEKHTTTVYMQ